VLLAQEPKEDLMLSLYSSRSRGTVTSLAALAVVIAMLTAILLAAQVAEAKGGGGGRGGGGGNSGSSVSSGKPYSSSSSSKSSNGSSTGNASANKGLPSGVANPSSPYYNSPRYGARYHSFSNFLFWSWAFHGIGYDDDDDELYEEEYIEPNYDFGGWALSGVGLVGVFLLVRALWKRAKGQPTYSPAGLTTSTTSPEKESARLFDTRSH
jgi:hypothetical protein